MPPTVAFRDSLNLGQVVAAASRVLVQPGGIPAEGGCAGDRGAGQGRLSPDVGRDEGYAHGATCRGFLTTRRDQKAGLQRSVGRFLNRVASWVRF